MVAFRVPGPYCYFIEHLQDEMRTGTFGGSASSNPEPVESQKVKHSYSYSISGTTGVLGSMLFTEASSIPGTWYDRTDKANMLRSNEADLGMSKFANKEFRKSARMTKQSLMTPSKVDVDIRFETKESVETITVRGKHGIRSFRFDFNQVQANAKNQSKNDDDLKPFMDTITKVLAAVVQLR